MAKGNIALGKFRGKVGGQVLRVDAGIGQIISEYNPHPSNPRTVAQTKQRSKMNLAGKLSQFVDRSLLLGLSTNARKARSMFVSNLLKNIVAPSTLTPGVEGETTIDYSKVIFANGATYGGIVSVAFETEDDNEVARVTLERLSTDDSLVGGLAILVYSEGGKVVNVAHKAMTLGADAATADFPVTGISAGTGHVVAYVVPMVTTDEGLSVAYGNLLETGTTVNQQFVTTVLTSMLQGGAYRRSIYGGVANYV